MYTRAVSQDQTRTPTCTSPCLGSEGTVDAGSSQSPIITGHSRRDRYTDMLIYYMISDVYTLIMIVIHYSDA